MAVPTFHPNQIVRFATSYEEDGDDLTGWRYYLLKEIDKENNLLVFFSITSNHNHRDIIFVSQYKITNPDRLVYKVKNILIVLSMLIA